MATKPAHIIPTTTAGLRFFGIEPPTFGAPLSPGKIKVLARADIVDVLLHLAAVWADDGATRTYGGDVARNRSAAGWHLYLGRGLDVYLWRGHGPDMVAIRFNPADSKAAVWLRSPTNNRCGDITDLQPRAGVFQPMARKPQAHIKAV